MVCGCSVSCVDGDVLSQPCCLLSICYRPQRSVSTSKMRGPAGILRCCSASTMEHIEFDNERFFGPIAFVENHVSSTWGLQTCQSNSCKRRQHDVVKDKKGDWRQNGEKRRASVDKQASRMDVCFPSEYRPLCSYVFLCPLYTLGHSLCWRHWMSQCAVLRQVLQNDGANVRGPLSPPSRPSPRSSWVEGD